MEDVKSRLTLKRQTKYHREFEKTKYLASREKNWEERRQDGREKWAKEKLSVENEKMKP